MSYYSIPLKAGIPFKQGTSGSLLLIDTIGVAVGVDVKITREGGSDANTMPNRQTAFRLVEPFEGVTFTSAVDTLLGVFLSNSDVQLGFVNGGAVALPGGAVITNTPAQPIPVNFAGTVAPVLGTLTNDDAHAIPTRRQALSNVVAVAPVVVGVAAVALVSDATLRRLTIRNASNTETLALGGPGVTLANSPIVLQPGGVYIENDAAGAAWFGIASNAGVNVQIQGLK